MPVKAVVISVLLATSTFPFASGAQSVTNYQAEGNLESTHQLGCIAADEVKDIYTPVDLYKGVAACVGSGNLQNGPLLFALAGVYGRFDTLRVADSTAHQAIRMAQMQELGSLPQEKTDLLRQEVVAIAKDNTRLAVLCARIRQVGPPNYFPRYMIQHGMGAFMPSSGNGLVKSFDPASAWEQSLTSYLHCPPMPAVEG